MFSLLHSMQFQSLFVIDKHHQKTIQASWSAYQACPLFDKVSNSIATSFSPDLLFVSRPHDLPLRGISEDLWSMKTAVLANVETEKIPFSSLYSTSLHLNCLPLSLFTSTHHTSPHYVSPLLTIFLPFSPQLTLLCFPPLFHASPLLTIRHLTMSRLFLPYFSPSHHSLPYYASPSFSRFTSPHHTSPHYVSPLLTILLPFSPQFTLLCFPLFFTLHLSSPYVTSLCLASSYHTSPLLTTFYLTMLPFSFSRFTSPHHTSPHYVSPLLTILLPFSPQFTLLCFPLFFTLHLSSPYVTSLYLTSKMKLASLFTFYAPLA